jgi:hypothetical protein
LPCGDQSWAERARLQGIIAGERRLQI